MFQPKMDNQMDILKRYSLKDRQNEQRAMMQRGKLESAQSIKESGLMHNFHPELFRKFHFFKEEVKEQKEGSDCEVSNMSSDDKIEVPQFEENFIYHPVLGNLIMKKEDYEKSKWTYAKDNDTACKLFNKEWDPQSENREDSEADA